MDARYYGHGPFEHVSWSSEQKKAIAVFEEWHDLLENGCSFSSNDNARQHFSRSKKCLLAGESQDVIPDTLLEKIDAVSEKHSLDRNWFFDQLDAAHYFYGDTILFDDAKELKQFVSNWEASHLYLFGKLADAAYTWQRLLLDELALAFFVVDVLIHLPANLNKNKLYIPVSELKHAEVSLEQLKRAELNDKLERLLWKQTIRARDAFAQGQPLLKELDRKYRAAAKKNWLTGLEFINEVEKRKYDVWSEPVSLSTAQKIQIVVLSLIGRGVRQPRG